MIKATKRCFDFLLALFFLFFLSPVLLFTAVIIKLTVKAPVIFKQKRIGFQAKTFTLYKFRTQENGIPVSKFCKFLRRTYIDELPQLWNVINADMSLVGPRPHIKEQVSQYQPWQTRRLSVKPGITGLRQVICFSKDIAFNEYIELDLKYIDDLSPWLDIKILLETFKGLVLRIKKPIDEAAIQEI